MIDSSVFFLFSCRFLLNHVKFCTVVIDIRIGIAYNIRERKLVKIRMNNSCPRFRRIAAWHQRDIRVCLVKIAAWHQRDIRVCLE